MADRVCERCAGRGGWEGWPGFTCYRCGGSGKDPVSAEAASKRAVAVARRDANFRAAQQATQAEREAKCAALIALACGRYENDPRVQEMIDRVVALTNGRLEASEACITLLKKDLSHGNSAEYRRLDNLSYPQLFDFVTQKEGTHAQM